MHSPFENISMGKASETLKKAQNAVGNDCYYYSFMSTLVVRFFSIEVYAKEIFGAARGCVYGLNPS